jgi:DNA (cytosine-5)-methyltransferase 1
MQPLLQFLQPNIAVADSTAEHRPLAVAGLFAGIGGIESGLHAAGHASRFLCEIDPAARAVLSHHFPDAPLHDDVSTLAGLPDNVDMLAAGFPCQDLSISGQRKGIGGSKSSLVSHVFRLFDSAKDRLRWLLLENVPFMLKLDGGRAMRYLIDEIESRGMRWAYRVVDTRSFGVPHRRHRIIFLASASGMPWNVLLSRDAKHEPIIAEPLARLFGFYWTEGNRGIGWSPESIPPLKVGSDLGIASSPAIWDSIDGQIRKLDIRDAERLQGFPADWTVAAESVAKSAIRWKLVGNAVSVPLGAWVGRSLLDPRPYDVRSDCELRPSEEWPNAAYGADGKAYRSLVSPWPEAVPLIPLRDFLQFAGDALSPRAASGLLYRIQKGTTNISGDFERSLRMLARGEDVRRKRLELQGIERRIAQMTKKAKASPLFAEAADLNEEIAGLRRDAEQLKAELEELENATAL